MQARIFLRGLSTRRFSDAIPLRSIVREQRLKPKRDEHAQYLKKVHQRQQNKKRKQKPPDGIPMASVKQINLEFRKQIEEAHKLKQARKKITGGTLERQMALAGSPKALLDTFILWHRRLIEEVHPSQTHKAIVGLARLAESTSLLDRDPNFVENSEDFQKLLKLVRKHRKDYDIYQLSEVIWALGILHLRDISAGKHLKHIADGEELFRKFVERFWKNSQFNSALLPAWANVAWAIWQYGLKDDPILHDILALVRADPSGPSNNQKSYLQLIEVCAGIRLQDEEVWTRLFDGLTDPHFIGQCAPRDIVRSLRLLQDWTPSKPDPQPPLLSLIDLATRKFDAFRGAEFTEFVLLASKFEDHSIFLTRPSPLISYLRSPQGVLLLNECSFRDCAYIAKALRKIYGPHMNEYSKTMPLVLRNIEKHLTSISSNFNYSDFASVLYSFQKLSYRSKDFCDLISTKLPYPPDSSLRTLVRIEAYTSQHSNLDSQFWKSAIHIASVDVLVNLCLRSNYCQTWTEEKQKVFNLMSSRLHELEDQRNFHRVEKKVREFQDRQML